MGTMAKKKTSTRTHPKEEKLDFQAEVSRLLEIVANALYSNKEIFLRELISNASDACDRLRYAALTQPELTGGEAAFQIELAVDAKARTLTVSDNGIGMNRDDLVDNLGTIARSGTAAFMHQLEQKSDSTNLIGQFGVGFYAAFMVSDTVEVFSRKAGETQGWRWVSDGKGEFTIAATNDAAPDAAPDAPARGTRIRLHLKKGEDEFLDAARLRRIVKMYSDHIAIPVVLNTGDTQETLNAASALWTRPKAEISDEAYTEFYHHVAHAFDDPWARLHFKAEGVLEYTGLLFIPASKPFDLFHPERQHGVKLYVKRVFISDQCEELVPPYLRFLRGIVDTEDLPLNINRETLQHNPLLAKIRQAITKRILAELKKRAKKAANNHDTDDYTTFWDNFGAVLKEGLYEDTSQRETLLELARFATTNGTARISLADYIDRMPAGQEAIYYLSGEDNDALRRSPHLEGFAAKGVEVLLLSDPVDEFWIPAVREYDGRPFKSVTRGGAELSKIGDKKDDDAADSNNQADTPALDALIAFVKLTLSDAVKDVRVSERLTDSAVCLVADEGDIDMHLERLLKQHNQLDQAAKRVLEINSSHPLIRRLANRLADGNTGGPLEDAAHLLLDQARILEGEPLPDPAAFGRRLTSLVERGLMSGD